MAVLFGGPSDEYLVSCNSAANVVRFLDKKRFAVTPIRVTEGCMWIVGEEASLDCTIDLDALLHMTREMLIEGAPSVQTSIARAIAALGEFDVVFPVLHGPYGEDGTVQALLELIGLPYVGNGLLASAAGMDKQQTKRLLAAEGMAVADGVVLEGDEAILDEPTRAHLGLPVFVKPARSGSSFGVSKVRRWADLDAALALARRSDSKVLVEAAVPGREVDVAVLQYPDGTLRAGPPLEILLPDANQFFDYAAKYENSSVDFKIPADLGPEIAALLQEEALRVFGILGCSGLLRVDFFLRPKGNGVQPVVNEVNTLPGLSAVSQYPQIWKAAGIDYPDLLALLIDTGLATNRQFSPK
ncbi:D-alanine--D-alanine ligase family protein [Rhodomicrobium sp. R_RK_3]|uniref:D-alanine--D-alanine ligase family protein n=1 Tax=Rhodomicrobium sp. R_RK_3 TaxID=2029567 RepID=UPI001AECC1BD|nr:D-alanine--D-alanine ligase family protein [Rhodomicrobium sp. R_RK_3]